MNDLPEKRSLTRDAILSANDLQREEVPVDEWAGGATVWVRSLTGLELNAYHQKLQADGVGENAFATFLVFAIVDENDQRLFDDDDAELLGRKNATALARLWRAAQRVNPFSATGVEQARKN